MMKKRLLASLLTATMIVQAFPNVSVSAETAGNIIAIETSNELAFSFSTLYYTVDDTQIDCQLNENQYTIDSDTYSILDVTKIGGEFDIALSDPHTDIESGDYLTFSFPDVLSVEDTEGTIEDSNLDISIATYTIEDNVLTVTWNEAVETEGVYDINIAVAFEGTVNYDQIGTEDLNEYVMAPATGSSSAITLALPKVPTEVSGFTKEGGDVLVEASTGRSYIDWTISVGTESSSSGMDLGGLVVTDTLPESGLSFAGAYLGETYGSGTALTSESDDEGSFVVTLAEGVKAPATIVVRTYVDESLLELAYQNAYENNETETTVGNTATLDPGTSELTIAEGSTVSDSTVVVPYTHIEKSGVQVNGNSMDWTIVVNEEKTAFYQCIVSDILSSGLTVDEGHGISILPEGGSEIVLTSSNTSDSATGISYTIEEDANGQQTLAVNFGDSSHAGYTNQYTIVFRTNIAVDYSTAEDVTLDSSVSNRAYIQALYPTSGGSGTGTGTIWGAPSVTTEFLATYIEKNAVEANKQTGLITWEIIPGTKITDYDTAVVTDVLPENDLELSGTPEVTYADGTAVSDQVYTFEQVGTTLTFTFSREALEADQKTLDDIRISIKTKALEYFRSNNNKKYTNTATVSIEYGNHTYTDSDSDSIEMKNNLLSKTVEVVHDDANSVSYFHFTIPMNKNGMTLEGVSLTDALSSVFKTESGESIPAEYYTIAAAGSGDYETHVETATGEVDTDAVVNVDNTDKTVTVTWPDDVTEAKTAHIYVSFIPEYLSPGTDLSQAIIGADNTVVLSSETLVSTNHELSASVESDEEDTKLDNHVLAKSGTFVSDDDSIQWTLTVNRAHADISNYLEITDVLGAGQAFDQSTFTVKTNGVDVTDQVSVTASPKLDGTTVLQIELPSTTQNECYVISYSTAITTTNATERTSGLVNTAYLSDESVKSDSSVTVTVQVSAKSSGSAKARVVLNFTKVDASSVATDPIPVAGALYGIYSDANCTRLIYSAYTDANGVCSLLAPYSTSNHVYYVKEISAEYATSSVSTNYGGYTLDDTVYGAYDFNSPGTKAIVPRSNGQALTGLQASYFTDARTTEVLGEITIHKHYQIATSSLSNVENGAVTTGASSTFKLYLYPNGVEGSARKEIGTYTCSDSDADGNASFTISDLTFGLYGVVESTTEAGYVLDSQVHYFAVDTSSATAEITPGSNFDDTFTILNTTNDIKLYVLNSDSAEVTDDSTYTLTGDMILDGEDTATSDTLTFTGSELANGVELLGVLKTGKSYQLAPTSVQAGYVTPPATVFTVLANGNLKLTTAGNATVSGTALTLKQKPTTFSFTLKDENGVAVEGAQIQISDAETGDVVAEYTTDGTTKTYSAIFESGKTYEITEISPEGIVSTENSLLTFTVATGGAKAIDVTNADTALKATISSNTTIAMTNRRVMAQLKVKKYDTYNNALITNNEATFEIHIYTGSIDNPTTDVVVGTISLDENGYAKTEDATGENAAYENVALSKGLPIGTYYVIETEAPVGYVLSSEKVAFEVTDHDADETKSVSLFNERRTGSMQLNVTTEGTASIDGASFGIYTYDESTGTYEEVDTITVSQNEVGTAVGTATDLIWGVDYYVKALDIPSGYRYDGNYHGPYVITAECTDATVKVNLSKTVTSITLVKQGQKSDGSASTVLPDATFTVTGIFAGDAEASTRTFTTDDEGEIVLSNLIVAGNRYIVEETQAPSGYGTISSFAFSVDEEGKVTQITAPDGSDVINENEVDWTTTNGEITTITMTDWMTGLTVKSTADENTKTVAGAEFEITSEDGSVLYQTVTVSADGTVWVEGLVPGTYKITETSVSAGYNQTKPVVFTIAKDNTLTIDETDGNAADYSFAGTSYSLSENDAPVIVMDHQTNQLKFTTSLRCYNGTADDEVGRIDGTIALAGVTYGVYSDLDCTVPVEDENGDPLTITSEMVEDEAVVSIASLNMGETYYLRAESIENQGLIVMDNHVYSATVNGENFAGLVSTETGEVLTDVVFEVQRGTVSFMTVSQQDDSDVIDASAIGVGGVVYGLYQLDETIEDNTEEQSILEIIKTKAVNFIQRILSFLFGDDVSEEEAEEAEQYSATITENGQTYTLVTTAVSDETGAVSFPDVVAGKVYLLKEILPPEGYTTSSETVEVQVVYDENTDETNTIIGDSDVWIYDENTDTYYWNVPVVTVKVYLMDTASNYLAGGVLKLVDSDGNVVKTASGEDTWVTDVNEHQTFEGTLSMGSTYTVQQLAAPNGYEISETTFTVDSTPRNASENYVQEVVVVDKKTKDNGSSTNTPSAGNKTTHTTTLDNGVATGDRAKELPYVILLALGVLLVSTGLLFLKKKES